MQPRKRFVANFAMQKFHQVKKDACVNCCFAVLSSLVVRIKVWDNIYLIALAWVPVWTRISAVNQLRLKVRM